MLHIQETDGFFVSVRHVQFYWQTWEKQMSLLWTRTRLVRLNYFACLHSHYIQDVPCWVNKKRVNSFIWKEPSEQTEIYTLHSGSSLPEPAQWRSLFKQTVTLPVPKWQQSYRMRQQRPISGHNSPDSCQRGSFGDEAYIIWSHVEIDVVWILLFIVLELIRPHKPGNAKK